MLKKALELLLEKSLEHKKDESLLIVSDGEYYTIGSALFQTASELGYNCAFMCAKAGGSKTEMNFSAVNAAIQESSSAIIVSKNYIAPPSTIAEAARKGGSKVAYLLDIDQNRITSLLNVDYAELDNESKRIVTLLQKHMEFTLSAPSGTVLSFRLKDKKIHRNAGILNKPGDFGVLPAGEVFLIPDPASVNGKIVVDGSIQGIGKVSSPILIEIENGAVVHTDSLELKKIFAGANRTSLSVTRISFGINPNAHISGNCVEDICAHGTVNISIGVNNPFPLAACVTPQVKTIVRQPAITADGHKMDIGVKSTTTGGKPDTSVILLEKSTDFKLSLDNSLYRMFFEDINLPYFIMDTETLRFLEVNQKFEEFTGKSRDELLSGNTSFKTLLVDDQTNEAVFSKTRQKTLSSELLSIKLRDKQAEAVPVRLNVKYVMLKGRITSLCVVFDMSVVAKMDKENRERMIFLVDSNRRIHALTEKIRKVPSMTQQLLNAESEIEIFEKAAEMLRDRQGLAYEDVIFFLCLENKVVPFFTTKEHTHDETPLSSDTPYARAARSEAEFIENGLEIILPLKGREQNVGVMSVFLNQKEKELMDGNEHAKSGYYDVLATMGSLIGLVVENRRLYEKVKRQAITDRLTKTFNRRYFENRYKEEVHRAIRYSRDLSVLFLDVDNFKTINDSHGHDCGDSVLSEIAEILKESSRDVDVVCRYGGDEFIILMPETNSDNAFKKAERIRASVESHRFSSSSCDNQNPVCAKISIGVSGLSDKNNNADSLFKDADQNLYKAKNSGRNLVVRSI